MKVILCQPAIPRFQWELDVLLANMRQFGEFEVILLFSENDFTVPAYFRKKYPECSVFTFTDRRDDTSYIPSIRPYLWWKYLEKYPEAEKEAYLYIDSDIIFREMIDIPSLGVSPTKWISSNCSNYIGYDYLSTRKLGDQIVAQMAEITGITVEQLKATPGAGAQWIIQNPYASFWKRAYEDSNRIHHYFELLDSDIQKWTAEMWAQLFGMTREGITVEISSELDFCLPTDPIERWNEVKILHNAGITADKSHEFFFKGQYVTTSPIGRKLDHVRKDRASYEYVKAIRNVVL